ncbi:MAG: methylmalonyl Co-A mutase-associated GTPase MeaB [Candidatus Thermoplasmatota archaeon]|nr:methylmalonyl Co-A mutase-associated GTPase MeaB [Candidatus Thermoplasmatota archaeon]MCL5790568.1 methylmalonyl Co-A mutase-associated GTPase MeaB [Candidatus Thermoplasmatota archaeon]
MIEADINALIEGILRSDRRSIARAISYAEGANREIKKEMLALLYNHTGRSQVVGITGPPGIGKSTLIGNVASLMSDMGYNVAILAIDASSPYTGGSLLGNRIRMQEALNEKKIFMRSLANRGARGGLSESSIGSTAILDAAGFDIVFVETVGAGQADLDVMDLADTTILVLGPGLGDQVQAIKAGIMEIADLFVINKMDRDDSYFAMKDIEDTLAMDDARPFTRKVVGTTVKDMESYRGLIDLIKLHGEYLKESGKIGEKRFRMGIQWMIEDELRNRIIEPIMSKIPANSRNKNYYSIIESIGEFFSETMQEIKEDKII